MAIFFIKKDVKTGETTEIAASRLTHAETLRYVSLVHNLPTVYSVLEKPDLTDPEDEAGERLFTAEWLAEKLGRKPDRSLSTRFGQLVSQLHRKQYGYTPGKSYKPGEGTKSGYKKATAYLPSREHLFQEAWKQLKAKDVA